MELRAVCLCAAWCHVCAGYGPVFASETAAGWNAEWIDIEDESHLIGDCEITQFPTLLVFEAERVYFAGPVRADASTLRRVLASCRKCADDDNALVEVPQGMRSLVRRLLARDGAVRVD